MNSSILNVWNEVERYLNSPFRNNMVDLVLEMARDRTMQPRSIAIWMLMTSTCICNAIFETDNPMPLLVLYIQSLEVWYPETLQQIYKVFAEKNIEIYAPSIPEQDVFLNILWAAGSTFTNGELKLIGHDIIVSKKGLQRFKRVWSAPIQKINYSNSTIGYWGQ